MAFLVRDEDLEPAVLEGEGGRMILAHPRKACDYETRPCTLHARSEHHMRKFPQHWRDDRGIMERICPHGIGHPDPDDLKCTLKPAERVHGCDGCCFPPKE